ncbi:hypothetical protein TNCV_1619351 [Trichonephila clavipes]|nr:hypothetical protein TNCV_1619351 [Trichonephila clavipes]
MKHSMLSSYQTFYDSDGKNKNAFDGEGKAFSWETTINPSLQIQEVCPAVRFKSRGTGRWISRRPHFIRGSPMSRTYSMLVEEISDTSPGTQRHLWKRTGRFPRMKGYNADATHLFRYAILHCKTNHNTIF